MFYTFLKVGKNKNIYIIYIFRIMHKKLLLYTPSPGELGYNFKGPNSRLLNRDRVPLIMWPLEYYFCYSVTTSFNHFLYYSFWKSLNFNILNLLNIYPTLKITVVGRTHALNASKIKVDRGRWVIICRATNGIFLFSELLPFEHSSEDIDITCGAEHRTLSLSWKCGLFYDRSTIKSII